MDEWDALDVVRDLVTAAGDDAAVVDDLLLAMDMLHAESDFPPGVTPYTVGWRTVACAMSDIAAMGGEPRAALAAYAPPTFEESDLRQFLTGAHDAMEAIDAQFVGGDLDIADEFTTVGVALGAADRPVRRSGAQEGDRVLVTGRLGRGAVGYRDFERGEPETGNDLFQFVPRIAAGRHLAPHASALIDSSDGLARSVHHLSTASDCGIDLIYEDIPFHERLGDIASSPTEKRELGLHWGEDFELVATVPPHALEAALGDAPVALTTIGTVTRSGVTLDGEPLPNRGFTHE